MNGPVNPHSSSGALSHLKVIDLTHYIAGPYCTKLFAGFGAEVIKVERPGTGDPLRRIGPFVRDRGGVEQSIPFLWFNTAKKSVCIDLKTEAGRQSLKQLVMDADIVVENFSPHVMPGLGLDYDTLRELNPRVIMTSLSNFGQTGPFRDYEATEITLYAMSGLMYSTGDPRRAPLKGGPAIAQLTAGMNAYIATLMACFRREVTGEGDHIDLSIQEAALDNLEIGVAEYLHSQKVHKRANDEHILVPWQVYPCRDGHAAVIGGPVRHWPKGAELFEEPKLLAKTYAHMADRMRDREDIRTLMAPWLLRHDKLDIYHAGQSRHLAFGYLATMTDLLNAPQYQARGFFVDTPNSSNRRHVMPGPPFRPSETPWMTGPAPNLGEHTDDVLSKAPKTRKATEHTTEAVKQPLHGVRIIDLTHDWAGPHATRLMGDYGAEVIKIEYPKRLDGMRGAYLENKRYDQFPRWWQINRNKKSITLDFHLPNHVQAFKELVKTSDVVIENSRHGVMEGFGLGYQILREIKPDLIMISMSASGATGPESSYAGYGGCIEALSGVQSLTSYERGGAAMRVREVDVTNGTMGACAVMTALAYRQKTGRGQFVDLAQRETCAWLIGEHILQYSIDGETTLPLGNRHPIYAPQGCYPCAGDDEWLVLTIRTDEEWRTFSQVAGHAEWAGDPKFVDVSRRQEHHDELDNLIQQWTQEQSAAEAVHRLQEHKLAAGVVNTVSDIAHDPHLSARKWIQDIDDQQDVRYPGFPFRFKNGGGVFSRRGPDLGEDNEDILCHLAGMSKADLPSLTEEDLGTAFDIETT